MAGLGVYNIAVTFSRIIQKVQRRLRSFVLLPAFSHVAREQVDRLRYTLYRVRLRIDLVFLPISAFLFMTGETLIHVLYDPRYHEAGWMLRLLVLRATMAYLISPADAALVSIGKPNYQFLKNLSRAAWIFCGIPMAYHMEGINGVVWCVALSEVPAVAIVWIGLMRNQLFSWWGEMRGLLTFLLGIPFGFLANYLADVLAMRTWFN